MPKTRTLAGLVMRAGEKAQRASRNVSAAELALNNARKAQSKADAHYLDLVRQIVSQAPGAKEGEHAQTAA